MRGQATACWICTQGRRSALSFDFPVVVSFQKSPEESIFSIVFVHRLCLSLGICPRGQIPQPPLDTGRTCHVFIPWPPRLGCGKEAGEPAARAPAHSFPSPGLLPGPRPAELTSPLL